MNNTIQFPEYSGVRCLMMPYIQGDPESVPAEFRKGYETILETQVIEPGKVGFLTIDESIAHQGKAHRASHSAYDRALHTEAGRRPNKIYAWGSGGGWGRTHNVELDRDVQVLLANNLDNSCAIWPCEHENTTLNGDIGHLSEQYPYQDAIFMKAGEVHQIGILTPHESLPVKTTTHRQFLRIMSSGVHGREPYFTENRLLKH